MKYNDNGLWKTLNVKVTDTLPVGTIIPYAGTTIPSNYMLCEGQALSRIEYDILFSAIGTTYGAGDGTTTFNLPNLKGRVITGIDSNDTDFDTLGEKGGEKTHTLTLEEMPKHSHQFSFDQTPGSNIGVVQVGGASGWLKDTTTRGNDQPHNIMQPYIVLNYIIKVLDAPAIQAQVVNGYSTSSRDSYSCNYANKLSTYSTDEIRVGTWMGKPLYRKVYYVNAFANNGNVYLDINVENVDTVISANGYAKNSSHTETIFLNSSYSNAIYDVIVWEESKNKLRLHSTSDRSGYSGYVWIEYTKTTD